MESIFPQEERKAIRTVVCHRSVNSDNGGCHVRTVKRWPAFRMAGIRQSRLNSRGLQSSLVGRDFCRVFLALASQFLLNLLGVGIGAAVLDPATTDNPAASTFSIVGGIWYVVAGIIAAFTGGYVASRLSGRPSKSTGGFHGLTVWAVTTIVVLYLLTTSVGALVGGAFSGLSSVVGGAGQAVGSAASSAIPAVASATNPMGQIEEQIRSASGGTDPEALRSTAVSSIQAALTAIPPRPKRQKHAPPTHWHAPTTFRRTRLANRLTSIKLSTPRRWRRSNRKPSIPRRPRRPSSRAVPSSPSLPCFLERRADGSAARRAPGSAGPGSTTVFRSRHRKRLAILLDGGAPPIKSLLRRQKLR